MSQALVPSLQWRILPGGVPMTATKMSNCLLPSRGVGLKSAPFNGRLSRSKRSTLHGRNYVSSVRADSVAWNPTENGSASRLIDLLNLDLSPFTDKVIAEYLWIGGSGLDIRSKARTVSGPIDNPAKLPKWNYDGSSTGQAPGEDSEVILYPQAIFKDPFRGGNNILVICDSYKPNGEPIPTNKRANAAKIFSQKKVIDEEPWYGIEQEYTLLQKNVKWPLGWPIGGYPGPQGPYYCGTGVDKAYGRVIADAHYKACVYAGIKVSGINSEVMPGQWEYQVGPSVGIASGDHLWCSRYILERITEMAGVVLSLDPKPIEGDWNGAGCHTNYSTKSMREDGGYEVIKKAILNLGLRHKEHISAYGEGNERRLTGHHETANINAFSWGVANRGASIRVGRETEKQGKGYLEDRRPASNMDPYVVTSMLAETTILWEPAPEAGTHAAKELQLQI
uniref:Glutamine synthetase n=1 Tax=Cycas revoluta TaxID=3396 RepID=A0A8K1YI15_CYCRE|nr:glutamine synthetase 2 [Cycas revoluta]